MQRASPALVDGVDAVERVAEGGDVERLREEVALVLCGVGFLEEDVGARGRLVEEPDVDPLSALEVAQRRRISALSGADGRRVVLLDEEVNRLAEETVQKLLRWKGSLSEASGQADRLGLARVA